MKTLKIAALVLGIGLILAPQVRAEGFFDLYGGYSKFSNLDATESYVPFDAAGTAVTGVNGGEHNTDYASTKVLDSFAAGFRIGGTAKTEHINFSLAFDNSFYSVGAIPNGNIGLTANKDLSTLYAQDAQGGLVWQPGVQFLVGLPLRYFRAYAGYGLVFPLMFYNYASQDLSGTVTPNSMGVSGAVGGDFIFGGRWLITKHLNLMIEDRVQTLYTPLVIKNSYVDPATGTFYNSSFTYKTLNANQLLIGIGYAWGS